MVTTTTLPSTDGEIARHQFYACIKKDTEANSLSIENVDRKAAKLEIEYAEVHGQIRSSEIRNKTLIAAAVVVWTVAGGWTGLYIKNSLTNSERFVARVDLMEKKFIIVQADFEKYKDLPNRVDAIKHSNIEIQRQIDELEAKKK